MKRGFIFLEKAKLLINEKKVALPNRLLNFKQGAQWMHRALEQLRGQKSFFPNIPYEKMGYLKYIISLVFSFFFLFLGSLLSSWSIALISIPAFYLIEVQWIFLFPVAIDGSPQPFRDSWLLRRKSFGILEIMPICMIIAGYMLSAFFNPRKLIYRWCVGCLAVLLIYEELPNV